MESMIVKPLALTAGLLACVAPALGQGAAAQSVRRSAAVAEARAIARAYQGQNGPTETFSRKVRLDRGGRVFVSNISGDISVTAGSGDEVSIEAVKRARGSRDDLSLVTIEVEDRPGRLEIRTQYPRRSGDRVSVDFTIQVPASAAVEVRSVSGAVRVTNVRGVVRAESVSGSVTVGGSPRVEVARSVSGNVELNGASEAEDLTAASVSGNVRARDVKARALQLSTVSGNIVVTDAACDRLEAKSVSGDIEYGGGLARTGRYDVNSHSGDVRLSLAGNTGFELTAATFSGDIRSELPVTIGGGADAGDRRGRRSSRSIRATFGDASAVLTIRTFSGDVVISRAR
jgi:DUF4097 and DUF4098 domain-containing protein YvlB